MADLSPMLKQYMEMKKKEPNTILFFRLGDFYEMFFDDAKLVSRELDLTLTGRGCGQEERAPMCGVPFHSADNYIARLVQKGYKVSICEQLEDPALAKGLVKRDIIRVITPGTVLESAMLDEARNNYICSVCTRDGEAGCCFADISTGELSVVDYYEHKQYIRWFLHLGAGYRTITLSGAPGETRALSEGEIHLAREEMGLDG